MSNGVLFLDVRPGERILIGEHSVSVELVSKSGQQARLKLVAPKEVKIELVKPEVVPMM